MYKNEIVVFGLALYAIVYVKGIRLIGVKSDIYKFSFYSTKLSGKKYIDEEELF